MRAQGDNLEATIAANPNTITGDAELLDDIDVSTVVTTGTPPAALAASTAITAITAITEENDGDVIDVVVTIAFDEASGNESQLKDIDLSNFKLTVDQNPR